MLRSWRVGVTDLLFVSNQSVFSQKNFWFHEIVLGSAFWLVRLFFGTTWRFASYSEVHEFLQVAVINYHVWCFIRTLYMQFSASMHLLISKIGPVVSHHSWIGFLFWNFVLMVSPEEYEISCVRRSMNMNQSKRRVLLLWYFYSVGNVIWKPASLVTKRPTNDRTRCTWPRRCHGCHRAAPLLVGPTSQARI